MLFFLYMVFPHGRNVYKKKNSKFIEKKKKRLLTNHMVALRIQLIKQVTRLTSICDFFRQWSSICKDKKLIIFIIYKARIKILYFLTQCPYIQQEEVPCGNHSHIDYCQGKLCCLSGWESFYFDNISWSFRYILFEILDLKFFIKEIFKKFIIIYIKRSSLIVQITIYYTI